MPRGPGGWLAKLLQKLPPPDPQLTPDAELLSRFARERDQPAFELLVWRHGGLVWGVCQRILNDEHLAEDAFQATFFILAKKAGTVRGSRLRAWLHKVARRVSIRAARKRQNQTTKETPLVIEPVSFTDEINPELRGVLDAEIANLPDRLRQPVLLCYLQDWSTDDAARRLGIPRGTVLSRMATARARLAAQLSRRGIVLPTTLVTVISAERVSATVAAAVVFPLGTTISTGSSITLAQEVLRMMTWKPIAATATALVLVAGLGSGVGMVYGQKPAEETKTARVAKATTKPETLEQDDDALAQKKHDLKQMRLENTYLDVTKKLSILEADRRDLVFRSTDEIDVKILLAELERRDIEQLVSEKDIEIAKVKLDILISEKSNNLKAFTVTTEQLNNIVQRSPKLQDALQVVQQKKEALAVVRKSFVDESPAVKKAQEELDIQRKALESIRKDMLNDEIDKAVQFHTNKVNDSITSAERNYKSSIEILTKSKLSRKDLVARIARARQSQFDLQYLEAELQLYQQLHQQLSRAKILQTLDGDFNFALTNDTRTMDFKRDLNELKEEVRKLSELVKAKAKAK